MNDAIVVRFGSVPAQPDEMEAYLFADDIGVPIEVLLQLFMVLSRLRHREALALCPIPRGAIGSVIGPADSRAKACLIWTRTAWVLLQ